MKKIIQVSIAAALIAATGSATAWVGRDGWGPSNYENSDWAYGMCGLCGRNSRNDSYYGGRTNTRGPYDNPYYRNDSYYGGRTNTRGPYGRYDNPYYRNDFYYGVRTNTRGPYGR
ncbi:MAG: hypothetical protein ABW127_13570 [Candidatus Thiodiazotropha endolucinida]